MWNCCDGSATLLYPNTFDLYTATTVQNDYGELERTWTLDKQYSGSVQKISPEKFQADTISRYEPYFDLHVSVNFIQPQVVFQDLMITNVRASNVLVFPEPYTDTGAVFEIRSVVGNMDVTGTIVSYIYGLYRSQDQEAVLI